MEEASRIKFERRLAIGLSFEVVHPKGIKVLPRTRAPNSKTLRKPATILTGRQRECVWVK